MVRELLRLQTALCIPESLGKTASLDLGNTNTILQARITTIACTILENSLMESSMGREDWKDRSETALKFSTKEASILARDTAMEV
jgi:hypothetical protein